MTLLERTVKEAINSRQLMRDNATVIVALSGGADSVALLAILHTLGYRCIAAHCNFHLRGNESRRDEAFARRLAESLGVRIEVTDFNVGAYCREHGVSVEMACRQLRYEWFERLRVDTGADVIAVGHHLDDNVETLFLNLLRGTGISGVGGIRWRRGNIVRPLLGLRHADLMKYLTGRGLTWVEDSTNHSDDFQRNKIRNNILPFIEQNFDNGVERIGRSIERIADGVAFFNEMVEEKRRQYFDLDTMSIDLGRLFQSETSARLLLVEWLREYGLGASVVDDVIKARRESGRRFGVTRSGYWLLNRGKLRYVQKSERSTTSAFVSLDSAPFTMEIISGGDIPRETDYYSAFFDISILDGNPVFELRSWQRGDRMKPFGMTGSKKLSDIFRDAAIPDNEKSSPIVLTRNGEIIWLIGLRHSRLYPVSPTSPRFLKLTYHK